MSEIGTTNALFFPAVVSISICNAIYVSHAKVTMSSEGVTEHYRDTTKVNTSLRK